MKLRRSEEYQRKFEHLSSFRYYRYYYYLEEANHEIKSRYATIYLKDLHHQIDQTIIDYAK